MEDIIPAHGACTRSPSLLAVHVQGGEWWRNRGREKVGHSRFSLVARQNSRRALTPPNCGRVVRDSLSKLLSCLCFCCDLCALPPPCWPRTIKGTKQDSGVNEQCNSLFGARKRLSAVHLIIQLHWMLCSTYCVTSVTEVQIFI